MRVLVATDQWFPDLRGGSARVATETSRGLARRGHDVTVIAPANAQNERERKDGSLTVRRVLPRSPVPQTFSDPLQTWRHARRLRSVGFDLLVAHQPTTAAGLLLAGLDAPLALVYHASVRRELLFLRSHHPVAWKRLATYAITTPVAAYDRFALRRAARIVILSEFTRSLLRADHPAVADQAIRVPGGADIHSFTPGDGPSAARDRLGVEPGARILLSVRRLEPRMGLEELIHALEQPEVPADVMLVLVGWGSLDERLRELSRTLGLDRRIRFVGRAGDEELHDWYRAADLFVLPTVAYEGFGMVTAEALASGTPVVGTPVGATPELLAPLDPRLISAGTTSFELAAAIARGLELATPLFRQACREYAVAHFDWDKALDAWEEAFTVARDSAGEPSARPPVHDVAS